VLDGQCTDPTGRVFATAILEVLAPTTRQRHQVAEHRLEGLVERNMLSNAGHTRGECKECKPC
jgi:hypothetical protein